MLEEEEEKKPILDEDEEMALDTALKNVKKQNNNISLEIERNNLRFCLKKAFDLLCELRTNLLAPKSYHTLYKQVEIALEEIYNYMKVEISRGREPWDIYDSVQQCRYVIPRLYLLILSGAIYIENSPELNEELSNELLDQVKEAQSPLRAMFVRYFLAKIMKNKFQNRKNKSKKEKGWTIEDTILFFVKNIEEMNRSWIRMTLNASEEALFMLEENRLDLKIIISETIEILSKLEGLTSDLYAKLMLPKLSEIIFMYDDSISQEYLMEYIFTHFPISYNIKNLDFLLLTISKLVPRVNKKKLFIILLQKLNDYYKENEKNENILNDIYETYPIILRNYNILLEKQEKSSQNLLSILEMNYTFIKFCIICAPIEEKLLSINHGLNTTNKIILSLSNESIYQNQINKLYDILILSLESIYSIFDMPQFTELYEFLDYANKKKLAVEIINNLININSHEKLDSLEKIQKLLIYLTPLETNSKEGEEENIRLIEKEQYTLIKLFSVFKTKDVELILNFYSEFKNFFIQGGLKRRNKSLPCLITSLILFSRNISMLYDKKNYFDEKYDITSIKTDEEFYEFISKLYNILIDILKIIEEDEPKMCIKYSSLVLNSMNLINSAKEKLEHLCLIIFNNMMNIYKKFDPEKKFEYFILISQNLIKDKLISDLNYKKILEEIIAEAKNMPKRNEQCNGLLIIAQIYFIHFKDGKKVSEFLSKAKKIADFSLSNQKNLGLFIDILNFYLYYIEVDEENIVGIKKEQIEEIVEYIQNFIVTIKNDKNSDVDIKFLGNIEKYLGQTINIIIQRKNKANCKEIYKNIVIDYSDNKN